MTGIEETLKTQGIYIGKTEGNSMYPLIRQGLDRVVITIPSFPLKKYDVPLYRRDGHYTLHRIVKVRRDGSYVICGDNRVNYEYDITEKDIVGVLKGVYRNDEYIECTDERYLRYVKKMRQGYPKRWIISMISRIKSRLKKIGGGK